MVLAGWGYSPGSSLFPFPELFSHRGSPLSRPSFVLPLFTNVLVEAFSEVRSCLQHSSNSKNHSFGGYGTPSRGDTLLLRSVKESRRRRGRVWRR
jgi:hypothetical protein